MSTRALYKFKEVDSDYEFVVYKHHDGYPSSAVDFIENALKYAWALPKYEADEFGCAFIAANKQKNGGSIRLVREGCTDMGQEYEYTIYTSGDGMCKGELMIEFDAHSSKTGENVHFKGTLEEMKAWVKKHT